MQSSDFPPNRHVGGDYLKHISRYTMIYDLFHLLRKVIQEVCCEFKKSAGTLVSLTDTKQVCVRELVPEQMN